MGNPSIDLFDDWNDGEIVTALEYKRERELLRVAIADNFARLIKTYKVLDASGATKTIQNLTSLLSTILFKEGSGITLTLDNTTSTLTISADYASLDSRYYTESETDAKINTKANSVDVYTKAELTPYLQGGDTSIKYEVYTIVNSNNGNGTFTYKDVDDVNVTGTLTAEGYQVFTLQSGFYSLGLNRIEMTINDTLQRSVASGGLAELTTTTIALTVPEGAGAEITIKYYERIGLTGEHSVIIGTVLPIDTDGKTVWFKVIG